MNMIKECNITVMVSDINRSIGFYESLGLKLKHRWENHYAMLSGPGLTIGLHPTEEGGNLGSCENISIGMIVEEANMAEALLTKFKIPFKREEGKSGIYLHFHDPDGTIVYFSQPHWSY